MRAKRKPKRRLRLRAPLPKRRMGTEVIDDRRTRRVRDRAAAERDAVERELEQ